MTSVASNLDFGGVVRGINHPDPVNPQDIATRAYVLASIAGTLATEAVGGTFAPYTLGAAVTTLLVTAASTFHGITGGSEGRELLIINGAAFGSGINLNVVQFSSTTPGGNPEKILVAAVLGTDNVALTLPPGSSLRLRYSNSRWRQASPIDLSANIPEATAWGRPLGAGTGLPANLTGAQLGAITRFAGFVGSVLAAGSYHNHALADGTKLFDVDPTGDVIFTGFALGSSNVGGFFTLGKFGADGRVIIKHNDSGSLTANRVYTPNGADYILATQLDTVAICYLNTRWQVVDGRFARPVALTDLPATQLQGTQIGRPALGGTGTPVVLTGLQQGENVRCGSYVIDSTTTGVVATYAIAETTTQVVFTGSGTIQLEGATIIVGKEITWTVDASASVVVTFMHDGAPTITQERFRTPNGQPLTIAAGESITTQYFFNRHRVTAPGKRIDLGLLASQTEATVIGRPRGAGPGAPSAMSGAQLGEILRLGTVQDVLMTDFSATPTTLNASTTILRLTTGTEGAINPTLAGLTGASAGRLLLILNDDSIVDEGINIVHQAIGVAEGQQINTFGRRNIMSRYGDGFLAFSEDGSKWSLLGRMPAIGDLPEISSNAIVCNPSVLSARPSELVPAANTVLGRASGGLVSAALVAAQMADAILLPVKFAAVAAGAPNAEFVIPVTLTAGAAGTPDDVTVYAGNAPYKFEIVRTDVRITTAIAGSSVAGRASTGGVGTQLTDGFSSAATGPAAVVSALGAVSTVNINGSLYIRRSDRGVAGKVYIHAVRVP